MVHDLFFKVELSPMKLGSQGSGIRTLQGQIQGVWLRGGRERHAGLCQHQACSWLGGQACQHLGISQQPL